MDTINTPYSVTIEGTAPLLMNRFADVDSHKPARKITQPTVDEQFQAALYRSSDGTLYQPGRHLEAAMIKAAVDFRKHGRGKKSLRTYFLSSIFVFPEEIPHVIQNVEIDRQRAVVRATRGAIIRVRGRLNEWKLVFEIQNRSDDLDAETVEAVLKKAGEEYGIGDYRPRFGRFRIIHFQRSHGGTS